MNIVRGNLWAMLFSRRKDNRDMAKWLTILSLTLLFVLPSIGRPHGSTATLLSFQDAGCDLEFAGSARKEVKLRSPDQNYPKANDGDAFTVADFLSWVCTLDKKVPARIPASQAMKVEKVEVTIEAFILAMKRDPDNDFHIQIGDEPDQDTDQVIVEVPPGQDYCDARQNVFQLFQNDGGGSLSKH